MESLIKLLVDNGIGVVCVGFMIYFINSTLKDNNKVLGEMQKTLVSIQTILNSLTSRVDTIEDKIEKKTNEKKGK